MIVREIKENELSELLALYTHLHESGVPEEPIFELQTLRQILEIHG